MVGRGNAKWRKAGGRKLAVNRDPSVKRLGGFLRMPDNCPALVEAALVVEDHLDWWAAAEEAANLLVPPNPVQNPHAPRANRYREMQQILSDALEPYRVTK